MVLQFCVCVCVCVCVSVCMCLPLASCDRGRGDRHEGVCVTMVFNVITMTLQWCYNDVTRVLQFCVCVCVCVCVSVRVCASRLVCKGTRRQALGTHHNCH
jgi:hypothetical protein